MQEPCPTEPKTPLATLVEARLLEHIGPRIGEFERVRGMPETANDSVGRLMLKMGFIAETDLAELFAECTKLPRIPGEMIPLQPVLDAEISPRFLREIQAVPVADDGNTLQVAIADPTREDIVPGLHLATGREIQLALALPSEIAAAIERQYGEGRSAMHQATEGVEIAGHYDEEDVEHLRDLASEAPVVRMVNLILHKAVELGASDIHIEPFDDTLRVRLRIDGILREGEAPPARLAAAVISRIKIMARLNIAERRLPQDGRIKLRIQGRELDLRVSTVPTLYGESAVMRLLDRESIRFDLDALGFAGPGRIHFERALQRPHGILLVTGPTGSGKTTTLYTALSRLNSPERKIITVEDPVEYQLDGINQIQVKPAIGLNFAGALRSIVRQDPDIIMIGEMRDLETAKIAVQSALTGHLVLSTLHTNDAAGSVSRMLDMGVEDFLLGSTVIGILAQRLVRTLCRHCAEPWIVPEDRLEPLGLRRLQPSGPVRLFRAKGCAQCNDIGYRGRTTILEMLPMTEALRAAIMRHATTAELERIARDEGMQTMYEHGLSKALEGVTTLEEITRVIQDT